MGRWLASAFDWLPDQQDVATFSLVLVLSTAFTIAVLVAMSWLAGVLAEALVLAGTSAVLRTFGGGAHLSSGWRCGWASAIAATAAAYVARAAGPAVGAALGGGTVWLLGAVGLGVAMVMARLAPVVGPEKPLRSQRHRRTLRTLAVTVSLAWAVLWIGLVSLRDVQPSLWLASTLGLLQEAVSVTPSGGHATRWLDRVLTHSFKKGGERA